MQLSILVLKDVYELTLSQRGPIIIRLEAKKQQKEKEAEAVKEAKTIAPVEKVRVVASDKPIPVVVQQKEPECAQKKEVPVTTVWNSAHVAQMEKDMREHDVRSLFFCFYVCWELMV